MRRWTTLVLGLLFCPGLAQGQDAPALGNLAAQPGWAGFGVVNGRLAVLAAPPRFEKRTHCADAEGQISEAICIKPAGHVVSVHYDFDSPRERLVIEALGSERVEIHRTPREPGAPVELHLVQTAGGDFTVTIGGGAARREFSAPDFWRFLLAEPDIARDCVAPLLETLRADWRLCRQAAEIEERLYELAAIAPAQDTQRWQALVEQLGETSFSRRRAADHELRAVGQALVPWLARLDQRRLDSEQRARLAGIRKSLESVGEDTPARVAARLVYDEATWLTLLARDDAARRAAAARHLCKLCPEAVSFDPQADQAVRRAQLRRLRQQLARD